MPSKTTESLRALPPPLESTSPSPRRRRCRRRTLSQIPHLPLKLLQGAQLGADKEATDQAIEEAGGETQGGDEHQDEGEGGADGGGPPDGGQAADEGDKGLDGEVGEA